MAPSSGGFEYLTTWKEIAHYLGVTARTVQRYERDFGLPIRRPTGQRRGAVIAMRGEIDRWVAACPFNRPSRIRKATEINRDKERTDLLRNLKEMRSLRDELRSLRMESRCARSRLHEQIARLHSSMPPNLSHLAVSLTRDNSWLD
jgi:hypothetical protein